MRSLPCLYRLRSVENGSQLPDCRSASAVRIGTTSTVYYVDVFPERNPSNLHIVKATQANLTYVAIDSDVEPRPIRYE